MNVTSYYLGHATPIDTIMSVQDVMHGPIGSYHALGSRRGTEPKEIVLDYLPPDLEFLDDDELSQVIEEACVMALSGHDHLAFRTVERVRVEPEDLPELKRIFGINKDLQIGIQLPSPETVSSMAHPDGKVTMPLMADAFA